MAVATCLIIMSTLVLVTAELLRRRSERIRGINR
jgi:putative spermidine/putrescine transport system permease protein